MGSQEINLAETVSAPRLISWPSLREYPTTSIRNHTPELWGYNIWQKRQLYAGGRPNSLDQIEHELLRQMNEPPIHFAIVCASKSLSQAQVLP